MAKKIFFGFALLVLLIGLVATLLAGDACREYFSQCTEGGCKSMEVAINCTMDCGKNGPVTCTNPVSVQ